MELSAINNSMRTLMGEKRRAQLLNDIEDASASVSLVGVGSQAHTRRDVGGIREGVFESGIGETSPLQGVHETHQ